MDLIENILRNWEPVKLREEEFLRDTFEIFPTIQVTDLERSIEFIKLSSVSLELQELDCSVVGLLERSLDCHLSVGVSTLKISE
jgi:hypothetical protein